MMKYRYTYYVLLCLALVGLVSCEMKDELLGKGEQGGSGEVGVLDLKLKVVPPSYGNGGVSSKSSSTELIVPKAEDMIVKVFNASMELQDYFESYADYLKESQYVLEQGTYYIEAYSGDNYEVTSEYPYYELLDTCVIKAKEVTLVDKACELQSAILYLTLSEEFLNACKDDYAITITNGSGVLSVGKGDARIVYIRPGMKTTVTIRATEKITGKPVIRTFGLADSEGKINPQDLFRIEIKDLEEEIVPDEPEKPNPDPDDPDNPEKPTNGNFTIKVDVTLNETPIDITVPSGGGNGGSTGGNDNTGGETESVISIKGDAINTDLVVSVPNSISSFRVIIDSPLLPESELQGIGLTSDFDLVSPGGYADKLSGLGFPVHIGGETSVSFNISQFVPMLQILGSGTSNFHLTVTDSKGNTKTHTITITT